MKLDKFLSEVTSHQKQDENPTVTNSEGSPALVVEYHSEENTMVVYFVSDVVLNDLPALDIPETEQVELDVNL